MKDLSTLENQELVDFVYTDIAGKYIRDNVTDWTQPTQLTAAVDKLQGPTKTTYLIGIFNMQVLNGGFMQYYENSYGQFAYETLAALKEIKAIMTHDLLKESLELINPDGKTNADFKELIIKRKYKTDLIIEGKLDELDNKYYNLEDTENTEKLLSEYLKERIAELK